MTSTFKKKDWIIIGGSWLVVQIMIFWLLGINDQEESKTYISIASHWANGHSDFSLYDIFYSGYISILYLIIVVGLPVKSMYLVQLIFSGAALYYFYRILNELLMSRVAIIVVTLLYATCYIIQQWVTILFTDSIFCNLVIIATYFLITENKSRQHRWICRILIVILPFFRPTGFTFLFIASFYWAVISFRENFQKILFFILYFVVFGTIMFKTFTATNSYYFPIHSLHNILGDVFCGYTENMMKYAKTPYNEGMPVFQFLMQNPEMTIRLFLTRTYKVFSMSRPFFSPKHNLLLNLSTAIYYILALWGLVKMVRRKNTNLYFLLFGIFVFALPQIIFCVEWSGRLSLPVITYILILCGIGLDKSDKMHSVFSQVS